MAATTITLCLSPWQKTKEPYEKIPKSYEWAIENAFKGRIVDSEDHLIIRNLGIKNDN